MSYKNVGVGGLATFNMQHGFAEAVVRGFRSGFLQDSQYHHLTQCETLEVFSALLETYISSRRMIIDFKVQKSPVYVCYG